MVYEIIVAFLGPLPLSRRPKSKPFTPLVVDHHSNGSARPVHPSGRDQLTDPCDTVKPARSYSASAFVVLPVSTSSAARS